MAKKKVQKKFCVSFKMTDAQFSIELPAETLEEALAKAREMGIGKALQQFNKSDNCWDDYNDAGVVSVWGYST